MRIAIGCDHIVTNVKNEVRDWLISQGHEVIDKGTYDHERTHYPIFGHLVGVSVVQKETDLGICICGTGVGISNAAQKTKGVRTALVRDVVTAIDAKKNYNANVISFGGRITGVGLIEECITEFINAEYEKTSKNEAAIKFIDNLIKNENYELDMFDEEQQKWDQGYYHD